MDSRSMGRELLDTFEAARKAADAAAEGGGEPDVERCVDSLRRLRKINVNMKALVDTQVGKRLRPLTKHPQEKIQSVASDLLKFWKDVVIEESTKDGKKNGIPYDKNSTKAEVKSERKETIKFEKVSKAGSSNVDMITSSESLKVSKVSSDTVVKFEKVSKSPNVKSEKGNFEGDLQVNGRDKMLLGRTPKKEKENSVAKKSSSTVVQPPKFTAMVKCNNPLRDKIRELLVEAFSRVSKETTDCDREEVRDLSDEVDGCDPIRVAVTVESAMYERLGPSTGEHKTKYRSIMFNLKDSKNIDFRRKVLLGEVEATLIADLDIEDMASDDMKLLNHKIKEKAMFECERAAAPKASTDQFKCGRCGQRKCTYYQLQTRSADEPMTTFVTCVNCNNHWKFC